MQYFTGANLETASHLPLALWNRIHMEIMCIMPPKSLIITPWMSLWKSSFMLFMSISTIKSQKDISCEDKNALCSADEYEWKRSTAKTLQCSREVAGENPWTTGPGQLQCILGFLNCRWEDVIAGEYSILCMLYKTHSSSVPSFIRTPCDSLPAVASDRISIQSMGHMTPQLSPQNLISCDTRHQDGCAGGRIDGAWWYLRRRG